MVALDPMLHEAYEVEAKEVDISSLMAEMLESFGEETGYSPNELDEFKIRKLMLARSYIQKEADRLRVLRDAVLADWDKSIKKKEEEIDGINGLIEHYIKTVNRGEKLTFDVGTASLRRTGPRVKVIDKIKARRYLEQQGELENFLKPAELDVTLLQKSVENKFKEHVEEVAKERIEAEKAENNGTITKKREKEILLEVEKELADDYFKGLPDFYEYLPESESLSIRMK